MRVLSSKIQFEVKKTRECPQFFCTLPADFISKEIEKHDRMPANCLERKTWRNARQFSYSACTFHFDSHWKTWRSARQVFRTIFLFFVRISFPGASRAALEDQVGSQVDLLMVLRTPFRKWTSPLCENPILYYVFEVAFCENPIIYHGLRCPGDVFWHPCGLFEHPWAHLFLTLASSKKTQNFRLPLERSQRDI